MKTLSLLRHAKSSWEFPELSDQDRPLTKRGARAAQRMARLMLDEKLQFDFVICSTAVRTRETWRLLTEIWWAYGRKAPQVSFDPALYHCEGEQFVAVIRSAAEACRHLLLIGHNPGLEELLAQLTGEAQPLPTAALAVLEVEINHWSDFTLGSPATLKHLWRPRDLPKV